MFLKNQAVAVKWVEFTGSQECQDLVAAKAVEVRVIDMAQGQKTSRLVAWTFQPLAQQQAWSRFRWG